MSSSKSTLRRTGAHAATSEPKSSARLLLTLTDEEFGALLDKHICAALVERVPHAAQTREFVPATEVARRCSVSRMTVHRWRVAGCPAVRVGDTWRYRFADVVRWLEAGGATP
ncbi:MAG: helix-turn-helix domain-containing protein [Myxococcota bacterium]